MTSEQLYQPDRPRQTCCRLILPGKSGGLSRHTLRMLAMIAIFSACLATVSCRPRLTEPTVLTAPYGEAMLWAVAPFANESGVSEIDIYRISDLFYTEAQHVENINAIPVNRTLAVMQTLNISRIRNRTDALAVMQVLGADGLLVGTVTAYDPYSPKTFGAAVQLFVEPGRTIDQPDPRRLIVSPRDEQAAPNGDSRPAEAFAEAAGIFEASNHRTLARLRAYSRGRAVPDSALGENIHLASMDRYMQFVSYELIRELLAVESQRLSPIEPDETTETPSVRAEAVKKTDIGCKFVSAEHE